MIEAAVVDSSVALKWVVEEEDSPHAVQLAAIPLEAPDLLLVECANALWKKVIRQELQLDEAREALEQLRRAPIRLESVRLLLADALDLAASINHPVYDCVYLALSVRRGIPLVTADRRLLAAVDEYPDLKHRVQVLSEWKLDENDAANGSEPG